MKRRKFLRKAAAAGTVVGAGIAATPTAAAATLSEIESSVRCYCGCGKMLEICDCQYADNGRKFVREKIDQGLSKEEIIQAYVDQFTMDVGPEGPQDYPLRASVAKSGKGLSLWLLPPAAVVVGASLVYYYLKRDVNRDSPGGSVGAKNCPECGSDVDAGAQFCPGCGTDLGSASSFCPSCGEEVSDKFCSNCGGKL